MLEKILESINSNLERIAKSQEELLKYAKEPITLDVASVKKISHPQTTISQPVNQAQNMQQAPVAQPQMQQPVTQPQATTVIPTAQTQETFTREQLAVAMSNATATGKGNVVMGILQQFGVQALTQINPADYNKVATMLKEAGVNV